MRRAALRVAALAGGLLAGAALAQRAKLEPSAVSQCVTVAPGARAEPEYPFMPQKSGTAGRIVVALDFSAGNRAPAVTVQEAQDEGGDFEAAVRRHAADLRLPCLPAGSTARLLREYVFRPEKLRVYAGPTVDADDARRARLLQCQTHVDGPGTKPQYPLLARERGLQGRVLAELRFEAPERPPVAQVYAAPGHEILAKEVEDWVAGLRMPCLTGGPVRSTTLLIFRLEGDASYGFKPMTLQQFMGATKHVANERLQFDTTQMGCPFRVLLTYRQPHMRNDVGSVGGYDPARHPLLEWLRNAQLDLPRNSLASVFGDTADISVPCVIFDIKPKEL